MALTADSSATIATAPGPICSAWVRHQRHAAQGVGDLVRRVVLEVRGAPRQVQHVGRHDGVGVEDLHDVTGGADGDLLADEPPRHRVQRLAGLDVTVRGDPPEE